MTTSSPRDPERPAPPRRGARRILRSLWGRRTAFWVVVSGLAILLGVLVVLIALAAIRNPASWNLERWLVSIAFVLPLAAALVALLWYGRTLHGAVAGRTRAEEGFRTIASTMGDGIVTIDDHSVVRFVNDAVSRIFGYTKEEIIGHELTILMPDRFHSRHRAGIQRYATTGRRSVSWEGLQFQGRHKDGHEIPLEISIGEHFIAGERVLTGIVRDVSERRRAERALEESEAKYRGLIESAPDGIMVVDGSATVLEINPAAERLMGRPQSALVGHLLTEFVMPERVPVILKYIQDRLAGAGAEEAYEGVWRHLDGGPMYVQVRSQVVRNPGTSQQLVIFVRDVSEAREMQRQLVESERWVSMGRLASFVAHEINTPLTNISLLTASVARRVADPEAQERLKKIQTQGKIAASITQELLRFARPGVINPIDTDLKELIQGAVEQAEAFRKPTTEIQTYLGKKPVTCAVDALRIHEVVVNLLKNAYEATHRGQVQVLLQDRGPFVAVIVSDTGSGIPPEVQSKLFEPFFTTKKKGEGTGLGLAISRNFVVSHGGDISVRSEVGKGTTFTVLLPRQPVQPTPSNQEGDAARSALVKYS